MIIREIVVEPQAIAWLPWAVNYFFFIGLSLAAVILALLVHWRSKNLPAEFLIMAIAFSTSLVAPVALTADLHQPSRIMNFYLHLTPWSWMAWGAIFLPLFSIAVAGYFLCLLRQVIPSKNLPKIFHILYWGKLNIKAWTTFFRYFALFFAAAILLYTTMEVFNVAARPLWHQHWLMPLIFFSALPTVILLYRALAESFTGCKVASYLSTYSLWSIVIFLVSVIGLYYSSVETKEQLQMLWHFSALPMLVIGSALLLIALHYFAHSFFMNSFMLVIALIFTWLVRWVLLIQVQSIPKYSALMNPYHLTWQVDGAIGILSIWCLWIFIGLVLWQFLKTSLLSMNVANGGKYE